jgi:hypothetical protein
MSPLKKRHGSPILERQKILKEIGLPFFFYVSRVQFSNHLSE